MAITHARKGLTFKSAIVTGAESEAAALDAGLNHFGESTERLYDWAVNLVDGWDTYYVELNTQ